MVAFALNASNAEAGIDVGTTHRHYSGHIRSGTGRYEDARGRLTISLVLNETSAPGANSPLGAGARYGAVVAIDGHVCERPSSRRDHVIRKRLREHRCFGMKGTITGEGASVPHNPDIAPSVRLERLTGALTHLGEVKAAGEMVGTGFIARGERTLTILIRSRHGSLRVAAAGPPVGGFASP